MYHHSYGHRRVVLHEELGSSITECLGKLDGDEAAVMAWEDSWYAMVELIRDNATAAMATMGTADSIVGKDLSNIVADGTYELVFCRMECDCDPLWAACDSQYRAIVHLSEYDDALIHSGGFDDRGAGPLITDYALFLHVYEFGANRMLQRQVAKARFEQLAYSVGSY